MIRAVALATTLAMRWVGSWPADFRPPAVLIVALDDTTLDRQFKDARLATGSIKPSDQGFVVATPQRTVVLFTLGRKSDEPFRQLQFLYGGALLDMQPTALAAMRA
jgi:hypothetical protein